MINGGKHNYRGFTLIEILVVVSIIGVIAVVAAVSFNSVRSKQRDAQTLADVKKIVLGLEMYRNVHGQYPTCLPSEFNPASGSGTQSYVCSHTESWHTCLEERLQPFIGTLPEINKYTGQPVCYNETYYKDTIKKDIRLSYTLENYDPNVSSYQSYIMGAYYFQSTIWLQRYTY